MRVKKSFSLVFMGVLLLLSTISHAQSVHFNFTDGTAESYNLEDVRKITFNADEMNLHLWDGSLYAWNVSTIGYYNYDPSSLDVENLLTEANAWDVNVYPNPTSSSLTIRFHLPQADEVFIALHDLQGKLLVEKNLGNKTPGEYEEELDLTGIAQGTYVCKISGQQNTITKQIIKQ
jgi:hypothetical protein